MPSTKSGRRGVYAAVILCLACGAALRLPALADDVEAPTAKSSSTQSSSTKLNALLAERRDVLKDRLEMFQTLARAGVNTPEQVMAARNDYLDAEYELAQTKAQRIEVLRQKLDNARQFESIIKHQESATGGYRNEVLLATARRLAVEIRLVREQE